MTPQNPGPKRTFTISRRHDNRPGPSPQPEPPTGAQSPDFGEQGTVAVAVAVYGAIFQQSRHVLAFLSAALGTGLADHATVRETPEHTWWVEIASDQLLALIYSMRGQAYMQEGGHWLALNDVGQKTSRHLAADIMTWPITELSDLLAQTPLIAARYQGLQTLAVVVPGSLVRLVVRRALALGLDAQLIPVRAQSLHAHTMPETTMILIYLRSVGDRPIPKTLVVSLSQLPDVIIGQETKGEGGTVIVDVNYRLVLTPALFQQMLPEHETWAFGGADVGAWRLYGQQDPIDGIVFLDGPQLPVLSHPIPALPMGDFQIPVRLIERQETAIHTDAILLDQQELSWIRQLIMGRPVSEIAFIIPGSNAYLLLAPGGLAEAVPFGCPLKRVGPGPLYLEMGTTLYPPVPPAARRQRFMRTPDGIVVLARAGAYHFSAENLLPAWVLWVGDAPSLESTLSSTSEALLRAIAKSVRDAERPPKKQPIGAAPVGPPRTREDMLAEAQQAELSGQYLIAAQLLERLGDFGRAGRLYEIAARDAESERAGY